IGNLLVIAFVSYFGAKLHRPKIIAVGCILMSFGTFLIAMPHFILEIPSTLDLKHQRESSVSMWIYVFLGNILRGIGETPVQPLGISYIDDYAQSENAALYIGCVQTISIIGPVFGYLLGSLCAKIYVDIGYVDIETLAITPADARWVGAWWLGYLIAGVITLMSAVPFWFLSFEVLPLSIHSFKLPCTEFVPTLKSLLGNPVYIVYLCVTIIQFNSLIGMVTYKPKYIEQHYGQSASTANFLMGMVNIPAVALGMFSGGVVMKKYKLGIMGAAKLAFGTSLLGYLLSLFFLAMGCENSKVAGITVSYSGVEGLSYQDHSLFSDCNLGCLCSGREWDPVCGQNGITYVSPCLAGCTSSSGSGKNTVFENCKCVALADAQPGNLTVNLGQCPHRASCDKIFPYFMALSVISSFIISLGGTPGFVLLVRCIKPELKSLALGIHTLATRTLAGIPAPIYFGAIIDTTCLKWGYKTCGGRGACRIYNTSVYRAVSFVFCILGFSLLKQHIKREEKKVLSNGRAELESLRKEEDNSIHYEQFILALDCSPDRETG
uniref:Solute carrier organic anion transporter family member n=1 Tax=Echeneis naucrates TaxID=173247 RepID=A0A665UN85_ECHNA